MITEVKPINLSQTQDIDFNRIVLYSKVMVLYFYLFISNNLFHFEFI